MGLGRSGWDIHANTIAEHDRFAVVAVSDPVAERREEAVTRFGCEAYAESHEVARDPNVDLVVVATPSDTHAALATASLDAGRHVVVEKPMARDVGEMDAMIEAAARSKHLLSCFQPSRFAPVYLAICDLLREERIGRVVHIRHGSYGFQRRTDWQMLRRFNGGELSNTGPHLIDQMLPLLGSDEIELFADLQHTIGAGDAEDHVKLVLKPAGGPVAEIEISRCWVFAQPEWIICGTLGGIEADRNTVRVKWLDPATLGELTLDEGPPAGRKYGSGEQLAWQEETLTPEQQRRPFEMYYDRLYTALTGGGPNPATPESVRTQIDLIARARKMTGLL